MRCWLVLLVAAAGCSSPRHSVRGAGGRLPAAPPDARGQASPPPATAAPTCSNSQYRFECAVPKGYLITQEHRGPGTIMTFMKQTRGSEDEATIAVKVTSLGPKHTLESFVDHLMTRNLKTAQGVSHWDKQSTLIGARPGIELLVDREYANGPYRSRIFCFQEGANVFIIDHTVPAARFDREKPALDELIESLSF